MGFGCLAPYTQAQLNNWWGRKNVFINRVPILEKLVVPLIQSILLCKTQKSPCSQKTEIQIHVQRLPAPFLSQVQGCCSISPSPGSLSLWSTHLWGYCLHCLVTASSLSRTSAHCHVTAAGCPGGSVNWTPVSRAVCALGAKEPSWPAHLCTALRVREWEQARTRAMHHGAAVSCLSPPLARCMSHGNLLQNVWAGPSKSQEWGLANHGPTACWVCIWGTWLSLCRLALDRAREGRAKRAGLLHALCFKSFPSKPTLSGSVHVPSQFGPMFTLNSLIHYVSAPPPVTLTQKWVRRFSIPAGTLHHCLGGVSPCCTCDVMFSALCGLCASCLWLCHTTLATIDEHF